MNKSKPEKSIVLIGLHFFLAVGALGGGVIFIIDPSGGLAGMSTTLLEGSFLRNYLIPGLILVGILGILPIITALGLIKKWDCPMLESLNIYKDKHWSWTFSLYIGFILIIWITIQVFIIRTLAMLQFIFIFLGMIIQFVTLLPSVQRKYMK